MIKTNMRFKLSILAVVAAIGSSSVQGADTDNDLLPDDWEIANQLSPESSAGTEGQLGDPDGDGVSNYFEYLSSTDPRDPESKNVVYVTPNYSSTRVSEKPGRALKFVV